MDTIKRMTIEEKENVLLVLNEFSEEHKENTKAIAGLMGVVKDVAGKINALLETKEQGPSPEARVNDLLQNTLDTATENIHTAIQHISFPTKEINQLSGQLDAMKVLLQRPIPQNTINQHMATIIWVAAGLFLCLCLVCSGWYMTAGKLGKYREGQLKYRYLKLTSKASTKQILWNVDSLYQLGEVREDSVMEWEAEREKSADLNGQLDKNLGEGSNLKEQLEKLQQLRRAREQW